MKTTIPKTVMIVLVALFSLNASAYDVKIDGIYYKLNEYSLTATVTYESDVSYNSYTGDIIIPDAVSYNGKLFSVTSIGQLAFYKCNTLSSVSIPNSVTKIEYGVFADCGALTSVTIPNSVTYMEEQVFMGCSGLTAITISNNLKYLDVATFRGCTHLSSIVIPNSVETIADYAFAECKLLSSITIPSSVTSIGIHAFDNTPWYDNKEDGVVYVGNFLYKYKGTMPDNTNISIQTGTTIINDNAFSGCAGLASIIIPNSVTSIGKEAFRNCKNMASITIPNNVSSVGNAAFGGCASLRSITISNNITFIGDNTFSGCKNLKYLVIPNGVTTIGMHAFAYCDGLESVIIPSSVESIGSYAFRECGNLTNLTIPNSVTTIGDHAFYGCSGLTDIVSKIENPFTFGSYAFQNIASECTLTVPYGTKEAYISKGWKTSVFKGGVLETTSVNEKALYNILSISDTTAIKKRAIVWPINMNNTESITALQFEVSLPTDITFSNCQLTERKGDDHTVSFKKLSNGNYQVTAISLSKASFSGTEGALVYLTLNVDENTTAGDYPISLKNIELTTTNTQAINPTDVTTALTVSNTKNGDANGDGKISITDAVAVVSHILGDDIEGFVLGAADVNGDSEVDVFDVTKIINIILTTGANSAKVRKVIGIQPYTALEQLYVENSTDGIMVNVNNAGRFTSFQMDIEVPDGVELTGAQLTVPETGHILRYTKQGENDYRIIALSLNNTPFCATAEGLLKFDLSNGGEVQINDILFVTPQGEEVQMESQSGNIATDIADIETSPNTEIYDLSGRKLDVDMKQLPRGMYIINGKKVMVK